jgi:hypothetical protein
MKTSQDISGDGWERATYEGDEPIQAVDKPRTRERERNGDEARTGAGLATRFCPQKIVAECCCYCGGISDISPVC